MRKKKLVLINLDGWVSSPFDFTLKRDPYSFSPLSILVLFVMLFHRPFSKVCSCFGPCSISGALPHAASVAIKFLKSETYANCNLTTLSFSPRRKTHDIGARQRADLKGSRFTRSLPPCHAADSGARRRRNAGEKWIRASGKTETAAR